MTNSLFISLFFPSDKINFFHLLHFFFALAVSLKCTFYNQRKTSKFIKMSQTVAALFHHLRHLISAAKSGEPEQRAKGTHIFHLVVDGERFISGRSLFLRQCLQHRPLLHLQAHGRYKDTVKSLHSSRSRSVEHSATELSFFDFLKMSLLSICTERSASWRLENITNSNNGFWKKDESWPENVQNEQILSSAGLIDLFPQCLCQHDSMCLWRLCILLL